MSCAQYLNWVCFSDTPYDSAVFEKHLREAVTNLPDGAAKTTPEKKPKTPKRKLQKATCGGMGSIGKLKGCCGPTLVGFWSGEIRPDDDTIGKYVIVTLRLLKYEGLDEDEAVEWVEEKLGDLKYTDFSDRLTDNPAELMRNVAASAKAVWSGNGYQKDPGTSETKLKASVITWAKRGFFLNDPATWHRAPVTKASESRLVWTVALLGLIPDFAEVAHCSHEKAKTFLELILAFVEENNELSESMVGRLLQTCGINGRSRQKQHDVRKFLKDHGLLVKVKNYYIDPVTGYRHGDFHICGEEVRFEEDRSDTHPPVSIYLSLNIVSETDDDRVEVEVIIQQRLLACEIRYERRIRRLLREIRQAV